jgi:predicted cytidylate kinase
MMTITISGTPGSGKSTVAKILSEKLELPYVYSGDIFRKTAEKYNMSLESFGNYCEEHEEIDRELDDYQLNVLKKGSVIVEGRIAGWLAHRNQIKAFKIMLIADIDIRAQRIVNRENGNAEKRKIEMQKRERSEEKRYQSYYNIDIKDTSIYDLVIDSSKKTPEEIVKIITNKIQE